MQYNTARTLRHLALGSQPAHKIAALPAVVPLTQAIQVTPCIMLSTFSTAFSILHCTVTHIPISIAQSLSEVGFHCVPDCSRSLSKICPCCAQFCVLWFRRVYLQASLIVTVACSSILQDNCWAHPACAQAMCSLSCSFPLLQSELQFGIVITSPSGQIGVVTLCRWAGHGCSLLVRRPWQCWWRAMVRCAPWWYAMGGWPAWPACCTLLEPRARKQLQKPSRHAPHHLHSLMAGCCASRC